MSDMSKLPSDDRGIIPLPDHILQQIIMHCQANEIAMAQIGTGHVTIILMANKELSPNHASIIASHMLLTGVLTGGFEEDNKERAEQERGPISKDKLM